LNPAGRKSIFQTKKKKFFFWGRMFGKTVSGGGTDLGPHFFSEKKIFPEIFFFRFFGPPGCGPCGPYWKSGGLNILPAETQRTKFRTKNRAGGCIVRSSRLKRRKVPLDLSEFPKYLPRAQKPRPVPGRRKSENVVFPLPEGRFS
jgi:hypothetical protein